MLQPDPDKRITIADLKRHRWVNIGYHGPPCCHLPKLGPVKNPDPDIIAKLCYFGFKPRSIVAKLSEGEACQEVFMYHRLLEEVERKKEQSPFILHRKRAKSFTSFPPHSEIVKKKESPTAQASSKSTPSVGRIYSDEITVEVDSQQVHHTSKPKKFGHLRSFIAENLLRNKSPTVSPKSKRNKERKALILERERRCSLSHSALGSAPFTVAVDDAQGLTMKKTKSVSPLEMPRRTSCPNTSNANPKSRRRRGSFSIVTHSLRRLSSKSSVSGHGKSRDKREDKTNRSEEDEQEDYGLFTVPE